LPPGLTEPRETDPITVPRLYYLIEEKYGKVSVNGAQVVQANIDASNGVIHAIDTAIIPE